MSFSLLIVFENRPPTFQEHMETKDERRFNEWRFDIAYLNKKKNLDSLQEKKGMMR